MCSDKVMGDQGSVQSHLDHPVAPVLQREEAGHHHCGADSCQGEPQHGRPGPGEAQQEVGGEGHLSHHHRNYYYHHHIILTAAVSMRQGSTANLNTIPDSWTRMEGFSPRQALDSD